MRKAHAGTGAAEVREIQKPDEQWRQELTPLQYSVLRQAHTERPFTGEYVHNHSDGFYRCAGCGAKLFSSDAKFDSGTGWPSFDRTTACSCGAPRWSAAAAAVTWAMSSTTGPRRQATGTASTPARWRSSPRAGTPLRSRATDRGTARLRVGHY